MFLLFIDSRWILNVKFQYYYSNVICDSSLFRYSNAEISLIVNQKDFIHVTNQFWMQYLVVVAIKFLVIFNYSDLIFTFILISKLNQLWQYSMVFLFLRYLLTNVLLMKTIRKGKKSSFIFQIMHLNMIR